MFRTGVLFVLCLCATTVAQNDAREERFRKFFDDRIKGKWKGEELPSQKVVWIRDFARHDTPSAARWLLLEVVLKEKAGNVVREAVRVLAKYKGPSTVQEMVTVWDKSLKKSWEARALALAAFGPIKLESASKPVAWGFNARDPRIVLSACKAAGAGRRLKFKPQLVKLLKHKHRAVRGAAALALAELRADDALPEIFRVFCQDKSHRAAYDAWLALKRLSLQKHPCSPKAWEGWWEEQHQAVADGQPNPWGPTFPRLRKDSDKVAYFFRIPVLADRICLVLDKSLDMNQPWKVDHKAQRKLKKDERIPSFFSVKTRWDLVSAYARDCLKNLPETTEVAGVFFSHELQLYPDNGRYFKNKGKLRDKLFVFMKDEVKRSGSTAMFEAFSAGWGFVSGGHVDKNFHKGCDTILFVTDGQSTRGVLANKADQLVDEIWRACYPSGRRVHTVGLFNHDFSLCQTIAKDNDGLYVHVQEPGDGAEPQDLEFWPEKKKAFEAARKKRPTRK